MQPGRVPRGNGVGRLIPNPLEQVLGFLFLTRL